MDKDLDPEKFDDVSDLVSLTSEQEINLLADSCHISQATVLVQTVELLLLLGKGDKLHSPLMASDYKVDNLNVTLGIDTIRN